MNATKYIAITIDTRERHVYIDSGAGHMCGWSWQVAPAACIWVANLDLSYFALELGDSLGGVSTQVGTQSSRHCRFKCASRQPWRVSWPERRALRQAALGPRVLLVVKSPGASNNFTG